MKHTPGPWKIDGAEITSKKESIALICSSKANAHLIASAPDLFCTLDELLGYFASYEDDYGEKILAFDNARDALSKAKGLI